MALPDSLEPRDAALYALAGRETLEVFSKQRALLLEVHPMVGHKGEPAAGHEDATKIGDDVRSQYILAERLAPHHGRREEQVKGHDAGRRGAHQHLPQVAVQKQQIRQVERLGVVYRIVEILPLVIEADVVALGMPCRLVDQEFASPASEVKR